MRLKQRRLDAASPACGRGLRPHGAPGHYVTLYLECIDAASEELHSREAVIGAYTITHEIGHLLLPTAAHAPSGIMRVRPDRLDWARAERGSLKFRPAEVQQMRFALREQQSR